MAVLGTKVWAKPLRAVKVRVSETDKAKVSEMSLRNALNDSVAEEIRTDLVAVLKKVDTCCETVFKVRI